MTKLWPEARKLIDSFSVTPRENDLNTCGKHVWTLTSKMCVKCVNFLQNKSPTFNKIPWELINCFHLVVNENSSLNEPRNWRQAIRLRAVSYFSLQSYYTQNLSTRAAKSLAARNERKIRDPSFLVSSRSLYNNIVVCNRAEWDQELDCLRADVSYFLCRTRKRDNLLCMTHRIIFSQCLRKLQKRRGLRTRQAFRRKPAKETEIFI